MREYCNIFYSKRWELTDNKNISKDEPLLIMAFTLAIEAPVNNTVDKVYYKIHHKGKDNKSGVWSSTKLVVTCHKYDKRGHIKGIVNPIEMVLMGEYTRYQQESFQNGSPRSL